jgi:hypothetical protein
MLQDLIRRHDTGALVLQLFDLMYLDGFDLTAATLLDRKAALRQLLQRQRPGECGSAIRSPITSSDMRPGVLRIRPANSASKAASPNVPIHATAAAAARRG